MARGQITTGLKSCLRLPLLLHLFTTIVLVTSSSMMNSIYIWPGGVGPPPSSSSSFQAEGLPVPRVLIDAGWHTTVGPTGSPDSVLTCLSRQVVRVDNIHGPLDSVASTIVAGNDTDINADGQGLDASLARPRQIVYLPIADVWYVMSDDALMMLSSTYYVSKVSSAVSGYGVVVSVDEAALYCADGKSVVKLDSGSYTTTLLAGNAAAGGFINDVGATARFKIIRQFAWADPTTTTVLLVADKPNFVIRSIVVATGSVSTFACDGVQAVVDGTVLGASCDGPRSIATTSDASAMFFCDYNMRVVRKIDTTSNLLFTILGVAGSEIGTLPLLSNPQGLLVTADQTKLLIADGTQGIVEYYLGSSTISQSTSSTVSVLPIPTPVPPATASTPTAQPTAPPSPAPPVPPTNVWSSCTSVIAVPGNEHGRSDSDCSVCSNGAQEYYPCDQDDLCYCNGTTIPPQYLHPYTYCDEAVSVPGNAHSVPDSMCAQCANAVQTGYPCPTVGLYCKCAECRNTSVPGPCTPSPATTIGPVTTVAPTTIAPTSTTTTTVSSVSSSSSGDGEGSLPTTSPTMATGAPTPTTTTTATTAVPPTTKPVLEETTGVPPTMEPPAPNGTKLPVVEVTIGFTTDAETLRANQSQLVTGLASATHVAEANIHVVSIEPTTGGSGTVGANGSTVVFDVETAQSEAELASSLKSSSRDSSSFLAVFGPLVESITLRTKIGRLLFALGFAFYFILVLGCLSMMAAFGWAVYRRFHPEYKIHKQPLVRVEGGRVTIGMSGEAYQQDGGGEGDGDAESEALVVKAGGDTERRGPSRQYEPTQGQHAATGGGFDQLSVMGPSSSLMHPEDVFHNTNGVAPHLVAIPSPADIFGAGDRGDSTVEDCTRSYHPSSDCVPPLTSFLGVGYSSLSRRPNVARRLRSSSPLCEMDDVVEVVEEEGVAMNKIKILQRASAKRSVERTLAKLQPSREVIGDDVAASYAMEGPKF